MAPSKVSLAQVVGLALLTYASAAAFYARTALSPLQEAMRLDMNLTDNEIALIQGPAVVLPAILITIPLGFLIDRASRSRLLVILTALNVAGTVVTALAADWTMLVAGRLIVIVSVMTTWPAALSVLADLFPPQQRGRAASFMTVGTLFGVSGAFALGGFLLEQQSGQDGWRDALLWMSAPLVVACGMLPFLKEPSRVVKTAGSPRTRDLWIGIWRARKLIAAVTAGLLVVDIAVGAVVVWGAPMLSRNYAMSPAAVGAAMATVLLVSGAIGPLIGGLVADFCQEKGGPRSTMLALALLAFLTVPASLFSVMPVASVAVVLLVVFKAVNQALNVASSTLTTVVVPQEIRGLTLTLIQAAVAIVSGGIAPVVVSGLTGALGGPAHLGQAMTIVCAASGIVGAVGFLLGRRTFARNSAP